MHMWTYQPTYQHALVHAFSAGDVEDFAFLFNGSIFTFLPQERFHLLIRASLLKLALRLYTCKDFFQHWSNENDTPN